MKVDFENLKLTEKQEQKFRMLYDKLQSIDWGHEKADKMVSLMRETLVIAGIDLFHREHIDHLQDDFLEPLWEEVRRKELELIEEIKQELYRTGATES